MVPDREGSSIVRVRMLSCSYHAPISYKPPISRLNLEDIRVLVIGSVFPCNHAASVSSLAFWMIAG